MVDVRKCGEFVHQRIAGKERTLSQDREARPGSPAMMKLPFSSVYPRPSPPTAKLNCAPAFPAASPRWQLPQEAVCFVAITPPYAGSMRAVRTGSWKSNFPR